MDHPSPTIVVEERSNTCFTPKCGSRIPCDVRKQYLNAFLEVYLKLCKTEDEAYEIALEEEKSAAYRTVYKDDYIVLTLYILKKLRDRVSDIQLESKISNKSNIRKTSRIPRCKTLLKGYSFVETKPDKTNIRFNMEKQIKFEDRDLEGIILYTLLQKYILTDKQLRDNGFPQQHPTNPGQAIILNGREKNEVSNNLLERTCRRCQKKYLVTEKGNYVQEEKCVYHSGRLYKYDYFESTYTCCQQDGETKGCCVAQGHVFVNNACDNLEGYVKTVSKSPPSDGNYGVYCLDCEMCYTTAGLELIRVSILASDMEPVYETLVKPNNPILDYSTKFSGVTEEDMIGISTTLSDVQAVLLTLFNSKTILIGHSLENDFKVLQLLHGTVVDTSVVFPHRRGPSFKLALRTLAKKYLNKTIQNSENGHDSQEDASTCMELMIWNIKEDIRTTNGWINRYSLEN